MLKGTCKGILKVGKPQYKGFVEAVNLQILYLDNIFAQYIFLDMDNGNDKFTQAEKSSVKNNEFDDLKIFIQKKKIQNEVLKKIITKLNNDENHTANK